MKVKLTLSVLLFSYFFNNSFYLSPPVTYKPTQFIKHLQALTNLLKIYKLFTSFIRFDRIYKIYKIYKSLLGKF